MKSKKLNTKFQTLKSDHAITLIALIITIIVMLILVAVTLSIALGENGVVNTAKDAAEKTNIEKEKEELEFLVSEWEMEKVKGSTKDLKTFLSEKYGEENVVEDENGVITITTAKGNELMLDAESRNDISGISSALTLNSNGGSIFTDEYLETFGQNAVAPVVNAKLVYTSEEKSIEISNKRYDTFNSTCLILVEYYENGQLEESFALRGPSRVFGDEGESLMEYQCKGYEHYPNGWTDYRVESICKIVQPDPIMGTERVYENNIYGALPISEYPVFSGEWEIDIANSDDNGIQYLSNVLISISN